ncbi:MAG: glycoside hydrolase [Armatimonadetes bacterium]|nr:glycoside hydrolase [Armatimonadota bacterium]
MLTALFASLAMSGQTVELSHYDALRWRNIGPFRAGRTVGASGIAEQPNTFFVGANNGGVWKTTDAGRTWRPIFDDQPTGSIGDVAVAPSDPDVIYVASGESLQRPDLSTGDGMYKSTDGGGTWTHLGLRDGQQIGPILIDPSNPDRVFVAVVGHPYGPNEERGIFRTLDGGATWEKVLYKDPDTGGADLQFDPDNSQIVYATMWEQRQGPWENAVWQGPGSGLYKSTDGGDTWRQLTEGLPTFEDGLGKIGISVAPSDGNRIYAMVAARENPGVYRSDDAGESWSLVSDQRRLYGRGDDFAECKVDPLDPDVVYVANTSFYRSEDAGVTWTCIKGSPGGDDYHTAWINPLHPEIILLAADQGATITVNGGDSWSSWYNQPTAQFYHVTTDNQNPYWVYSGQQENGSVMASSRGNDGQVTYREWHWAGGDEYGYLAPDPLNPRYVYGGRIKRYDKVTGEIVSVRPQVPYRVIRTAPVVFSTVDPSLLFFAGNLLFKTRDGGQSWETISPDLSREQPAVPASVGKYFNTDMETMARRGVIYTVAPSYLEIDTIWCGTDDGLIWVTTDGGANWADVTPPSITSWSKVSIMDAGHFDTQTAYAAVNRIRLDDQMPHIYRTHDGGATWTEIVNGLPPGPINVVREDPLKPGLLFCGSETAVYFSIDDGDNWHPLRLNMPGTSVRDLVVHEDDLVIGTHGRGFWILDNFSLLRHIDGPMGASKLFPPPPAYQFERNWSRDTPLPPEEPAGQNPPDGATIDYWLPNDVSKVTIEIVAPDGTVVRTFASDDPIEAVDPDSLTVMPGWVRPQVNPSAMSGSHRFVWDLRAEAVVDPNARRRRGPPISAIWGDTPHGPLGDWVDPGTYTVRLTAGIRVMTQTLEVRADPRK